MPDSWKRKIGCGKITLGSSSDEVWQLDKKKKNLLFFSVGLLILLMPLFTHGAGIQWQSYKDGMARGKSEKKRIFINFYADW